MSANVHSTDAIERFRLAVLTFGEQCERGLEEIEGETRRMIDWLENDRPKYWRLQLHKAHDDVHQTKINLQRCLNYPIADERPSCHEERAALKTAQARLDYCRDKVERVKHWCREIQHELLEYQGRVTQLTSCAEIDIPQAAATLKRLLAQLAAYQETRSGVEQGNEVSMARPLTESEDSAITSDDSATESSEIE